MPRLNLRHASHTHSCQDVIIEPMNRHHWAPRLLCLRAFVVHNGTTKTQRHEAKKV